MNTRMGARPWLAHTQYAYATMLLARNQPDDRHRPLRCSRQPGHGSRTRHACP